MAEQMFLVEARRARRGDQPAGIARFILCAGSRYAALSKLRVHYDTDDLDSLTAEPVSGIVPIAGALVHDMTRKPRQPERQEAEDDANDEPWQD